jgi:hypothetical protein
MQGLSTFVILLIGEEIMTGIIYLPSWKGYIPPLVKHFFPHRKQKADFRREQSNLFSNLIKHAVIYTLPPLPQKKNIH